MYRVIISRGIGLDKVELDSADYFDASDAWRAVFGMAESCGIRLDRFARDYVYGRADSNADGLTPLDSDVTHWAEVAEVVSL